MKKLVLLLMVMALFIQGCNETDPESSSPQYIDVNKYSGDKLDIIKLINLRMKYIAEDNEKEYMSLFTPNSPINGMSRYKLKTVTLTSEIKISNHKNYDMALVRTEEVFIENEISNVQYVFVKEKGQDDRWMILDID